jgi:hypothetical protein
VKGFNVEGRSYFRRDLCDLLGRARQKRYACALARKRKGDGASDAASAACDERCFIFELQLSFALVSASQSRAARFAFLQKGADALSRFFGDEALKLRFRLVLQHALKARAVAHVDGVLRSRD